MLAAPAFAAAALGRRREVIFPIGRRVLLFTEITVSPSSSARARTIKELQEAGASRIRRKAGARTGSGGTTPTNWRRTTGWPLWRRGPVGLTVRATSGRPSRLPAAQQLAGRPLPFAPAGCKRIRATQSVALTQSRAGIASRASYHRPRSRWLGASLPAWSGGLLQQRADDSATLYGTPSSSTGILGFDADPGVAEGRGRQLARRWLTRPVGAEHLDRFAGAAGLARPAVADRELQDALRVVGCARPVRPCCPAACAARDGCDLVARRQRSDPEGDRHPLAVLKVKPAGDPADHGRRESAAPGHSITASDSSA